MMKARSILIAFGMVAAGILAGCASTGTSSGTRSDILTREEILGAQGAQNLYEVVQRLRPRWLTPRARERSFATSTGIVVFQGQSYLGDLDSLRQLGPSSAYQLLYLDGPKASATLSGYPGQHVAGAIVVSLSPVGST